MSNSVQLLKQVSTSATVLRGRSLGSMNKVAPCPVASRKVEFRTKTFGNS